MRITLPSGRPRGRRLVTNIGGPPLIGQLSSLSSLLLLLKNIKKRSAVRAWVVVAADTCVGGGDGWSQ